MTRGLAGLLLGIALLAGWGGALAAVESSSAATADAPAAAQYLLVGVRGGASWADLERHVRSLGMEPQRAIPALHVLRVMSHGSPRATALASLAQLAEVAYVEEDARVIGASLPDDPFLSQQWALEKIRAPEAWEVVTGTEDLIVAVIDSGVATAHPDLAPRLWRNDGETPGNGLDDDGNGYVDDAGGCRFYHAYTGREYVPAQDGEVEDDYGHGSHVSGILAAQTDNGLGVSGVTWSGRLMPVKVLDEFGNGWYSDIAEGIIYAAENGARVINLSLGGSAPSETLCTAVERAGTLGALVVAATGNSGGSVFYPAACSGALAVAALDADDRRPSWSNSGPETNISAPGASILSTWPWVSGYFTKSGTSMATPFVSGAAALVWARWPDWTAAAVRSRLLDTAVEAGEPGWDPYTGWGRLDLAAAVGVDEIGADLGLAVLLEPDPVQVGNPITLTVTVRNAGPAHAGEVTMTLRLPAELFLQPLAGSVASSLPDCAMVADVLGCHWPRLGLGETMQVKLGGSSTLSEGASTTMRIALTSGTRDPVISNDALTLTVGPAIVPMPELRLRAIFPWIP